MDSHHHRNGIGQYHFDCSGYIRGSRVGNYARLREGKISAQTAHIARTAMDGRVSSQSYTVVYLTTPVVQSAEDLLERHPLRAYDAIQLASALEANTRLVAAQASPLIFVSADQRLLDAATAEGLSTDNPNVHP